ncbi:Crp/Fnr family transcriptional regulator [Segetibacter sp. 3557_3]|uniref:Crp/Fnr family transcriptional regulator n=1 Tax=Segetibacter sp. 3557_3 TaxID=2547429 RepID=UPI001058EE1E|nr:Crp/Fnr family transcriptional regulator [Segetibacter sp. 3557_3]TDH24564.1 Crp/Fnr family transcriptional regulator [Segetibacter sp. 3557_3]
MDIPEYKKLRAAIERFVTLSSEDWLLLEKALSIRTIKKNGLFATEGKKATEVGFLLEGNMRHYYTKDGEEKTTYFYFENHFVAAYISCITQQPSQLSIEALTDCTMLVFPYQTLVELYAISHTWERFGRLLAEYLAIGLEERMVALLMQTPEERYRQLLEGNKQKIIERIPQHLIASYLGITPVSLSRIRNRTIK